MNPRKFLSPVEASAYLAEIGIVRTVGTLSVLRVRGGGPAFIKVSRQVRYPLAELDKWVAGFVGTPLRSTSEINSTAQAVA